MAKKKRVSKKKAVNDRKWLGPLLALVAIILISLFLINVGRILPSLKINDTSKVDSMPASDVAFARLDYGTSPAAKVTVLEFSDFQCPYCARAAPTLHKIMDVYGDKVNVLFKHFPMSYHSNAKKAAEAAECARDQGKFWDMHDVLFGNADSLSVDAMIGYAQKLGLDVNSFSMCLNSGVKSVIVDQDFREGVMAGVRGTPSFVVNGRLMAGAQPFEAFASVIDMELKNSASGVEPVENVVEQ